MTLSDLRKADWSDPERVTGLVQSYKSRYDEYFWSTFRKASGPDRRYTIAEFGCGPGLFLNDAVDIFNPEFVYGFDASSVMLDQAKEFLSKKMPSSKVRLQCIDFDRQDIPIDDTIVDLSFSGFFLHEVAHPESHIRDAFTILSSGGKYVIYDFVSGNKNAFVQAMVQRGMSEDRAETRYPHMCRHSIDDIVELFEDSDYNAQSFRVDEFRAIVVGAKN